MLMRRIALLTIAAAPSFFVRNSLPNRTIRLSFVAGIVDTGSPEFVRY